MKKPSVLDRDTIFYQFDQSLGFWGIPSVERLVVYGGEQSVQYNVRHNEYGVRDISYRDKNFKNPIIALGGSNTWGSAVEESVRFTNVLQRAIRKPVLNFGHNSFGLDQVALTLLTKTEEFHPSVVLVEQYPWALHRVLSHFVNGYAKPYFSLRDDGSLKFYKVPKLARLKLYRKILGSYRVYKKQLMEFQSGIDLATAYDPLTDPIFLLWKTGHYEYMYQLVEKILIIIRDYCRTRNIQLLFLVLPIAQQFGAKSGTSLIDYGLPERKFVSLLKTLEIPHMQFPELLKTHTKNHPVVQFDGHLNTRGHALVAHRIEELFKKKIIL